MVGDEDDDSDGNADDDIDDKGHDDEGDDDDFADDDSKIGLMMMRRRRRMVTMEIQQTAPQTGLMVMIALTKVNDYGRGKKDDVDDDNYDNGSAAEHSRGKYDVTPATGVTSMIQIGHSAQQFWPPVRPIL